MENTTTSRKEGLFLLFKDLGGEFFLMGATLLDEPERTKALEEYLEKHNVTITLPSPLTIEGLAKAIEECKKSFRLDEARDLARLLFGLYKRT